MSDFSELYFDVAPNMGGMYMCAKCHGWFKRNEVDVCHKVPLENGGTDTLDNLQAICLNCATAANDVL